MPLYKQNGANTVQLAQSAMSGAVNSASSMQRERTVEHKRESNLLEDIGQAAQIAGNVIGAVDKGWNLYDRYKERAAYDNISKAYSEGGMEAIENNPDLQDYWHAKAAGQFFQDRAKSEKGQAEMMANLDKRIAKIYDDWRVKAYSVRNAYENKDMERYMAGMEDLVASAPMPYRLKTDGNGNFRELFRSDKDMGWVETGRTYSPEQAFEIMNGILRGEQMVIKGAEMKPSIENERFMQEARRRFMATDMGNQLNRIDPKKQMPLYDRNGNLAGIGVPQSRLDDYNAAPYLQVYDMNSKKALGTFDGLDSLMQSTGLSPFRQGGGRGGGRARAGGRSGGGYIAQEGAEATQGGGVQYKVTAGDRAFYRKNSMAVDEDTGEKGLNAGKANVLAMVQQNTGLAPEAVLQGYNQLTEGIMKEHNLDRNEAEKYASQVLINQYGRGGKQSEQPLMAPSHTPLAQGLGMGVETQGEIQEGNKAQGQRMTPGQRENRRRTEERIMKAGGFGGNGQGQAAGVYPYMSPKPDNVDDKFTYGKM